MMSVMSILSVGGVFFGKKFIKLIWRINVMIRYLAFLLLTSSLLEAKMILRVAFFFLIFCNLNNLAYSQDSTFSRRMTRINVQVNSINTVGFSFTLPINRPLNPRLTIEVGSLRGIAAGNMWHLLIRKDFILYNYVGSAVYDNGQRFIDIEGGIGNVYYLSDRLTVFFETNLSLRGMHQGGGDFKLFKFRNGLGYNF